MTDSFILDAYARISSSLSIEQSLERAYQHLKERIPADGAFIDIYLESLRQIRFLALVEGNKTKRFNHPIELTSEMERSLKCPDRPKIRCINSIDEDPVTLHVANEIGFRVESLIILRLELDNQHLGVVAFFNHRPFSFSNVHADLLAELHNSFALVTANALHPILKAENISLRKKNEQLQTQLTKIFDSPIEEFLQVTPGLKHVAEKITRVAPYDTTVLIQGETGCGKEVVANMIHHISDRSHQPFVKVNCGAIPEALVDSQLFGHEKGAFTDAKNVHLGYFEQANGGTLFLDEVADLPFSAQVRLLRVLQNKTITRVGGIKPIALDVRIITATHKPLETLVDEGGFRDDLWYRLNVFPIFIPPLRERVQDILPLASYILKRLQSKYKLPYLPYLSDKAAQQALVYSWKGNVRELENVLERSVLQSNTKTINLVLSGQIEHKAQAKQGLLPNVFQVVPTSPAIEPLDKIMSDYLGSVLNACNGKISGQGGAAEKLGMHPNTLRSKLQKLNILPLRNKKSDTKKD